MSFREPGDRTVDATEWAELHGETRHDREAPSVDETVTCSQCGARVDAEATRLCEQADCGEPVCTACEKAGLLRDERGIPTCGSCSAR